MQPSDFLQRKIIIPLILLVVGMIGYFVLSTPLYKGFALHETPYRSDTFSTIQKDALYNYNGISFYKTNLNNQDSITVLSDGNFLPVVETLNWAGDNGVLLTFSDIGVAGSDVEKQLLSRGTSFNLVTQRYIWYLDFKTNKLHLVDTIGFAGDTVYYDIDKQGFYYIGYNEASPDSGGDPLMSVMFFSTVTATKSFVAELGDDGATVEFLGPCYGNKHPCLVKDNGDTATLNLIKGENLEIIKTGEYDSFTPTSNPSVFIGLKYDSIQNAKEDEILEATASYLDINTNTSTKLNYKYRASDSILANIDATNNSFYVFQSTPTSDDGAVPFFTGAQNIFGTPKVKRTAFVNSDSHNISSKSIQNAVSHNDTGAIMFYDTDGVAYLIVPKSSNFTSNNISSDQSKTSLSNCFKSYTVSQTYSEEYKQFKVGVLYDNDYASKIKQFSNCVNSTAPKAQLGYSYIFVGLSSDGRFVTN